MTLAEVAVTTVIAGTILLGLGIVYLFGVDAWLRTHRRVEAQQAGARAIYAVSRLAQKAYCHSAVIAAGGREISLACPVYGINDTDNVVVALRGLSLVAYGDEVWQVPDRETDSLLVMPPASGDFFELTADSILTMRFRIASTAYGAVDTLHFESSMAMRNL